MALCFAFGGSRSLTPPVMLKGVARPWLDPRRGRVAVGADAAGTHGGDQAHTGATIRLE